MASDNWGNTIVVDWWQALVAGFLAEGNAAPPIAGRATGYTATSAASNKTIRATTYTPQTVTGQRSVASSSANDTAAGTGAQQIMLTYLTSAFVLESELITLNGTTPVNTVGTDILYVESMVVTQTGTSSGTNLGTISLYTGTAGSGSVWASIAVNSGVGDNMTFWAAHYVPAGVTCYITSMAAAAYGVLGTMSLLRHGNPSLTNQPLTQIGPTLLHPAGDQREHQFQVPLAVQGPDLIEMISHPVSATSDTSLGTFEYVQF